MNWTFFGFNSWNFIDFIIKNVDSILSIIRLSCGIKKCLKLHQKRIGCRAEFDLYLFSLFYIFNIKGFISCLIIKFKLSFVLFFIQKYTTDCIFLESTNFRNFKKLYWPSWNFSHLFMGTAINFYHFRIITEIVFIIWGEPNKWVGLLVKIARMLSLEKLSYEL